MSHVPTFGSLDEIYDKTTLGKQGVRYNQLIEKFTELYGRQPEFIARSPGRVNLIGEHIDYCGFGVLPMAIERDVAIAVACTDETTEVQIANMNPKYHARKFNYEGKDGIVTIDSTVLEWSNYFKCGYKGMLERAENIDRPKGLFLLVDGTVPPGSGLSSSAAFVCASALAVITANKLPMSKQELTEVAIVAERNVGVNSGGMDQSASVFAQKGFALHVEFVPKLNCTPVPLPKTKPEMVFVIANTLVTADKFTTASRNYNLRVVETAIGALIMAKKLGIQDNVANYKEVMDKHFKGQNVDERSQLRAMLKLVDEIFSNRKGYELEELAVLSGTTQDDLVKRYMTRFPIETDIYRLHQRATHVFGEALRVVEFDAVCNSPPSDSEQVMRELADLMNASQKSCRDLFNCSCPEIDEMVQLALSHGALGSRLSGAGWGGATVSLVPSNKVENFISAIKQTYYKSHFPKLSEEELDDAILASQPCSGSSIFVGF
ncbi:galactokinase [Radiomyces spectabilis]|uniref:galactokinase n=1 Tax=Radiomyces spectabilis TaxID=64574 RepID=UPI00221FD88F|nr:galactokinase [Radiomyces spectabilis]KAI8371369.1 galactokinase [Radiomyces spectabilis]